MTLSQTYISRKQLLVDNLVAKGVTGYTVNDGLTTLINAVLEIQGGGVRTLTLTSDKDILSYADRESATLTATLLEDGVGVSGATVEFFNGSTSLGTAQTDSNGVATKTYTSTGAGDISLSASTDNGILISDTYEVSDYWYYNHNDNTVFDNAPNVSGDYFVVSSNKEEIPLKNPIELPSEWKITYIMQKWGSGSNWTMIAFGESYTGSNYYNSGKLNATIGAIRPRNTFQILSQFNDYCSNNTDYIVTLTYQNGIYTLSYNGRSCTVTDDSIQPLFFLGIGMGSNAKIKDIIIEKL